MEVTVAEEKYTCEDCGLVFWGEVLNMVGGDTHGLLGNYCPRCGCENLDPDERYF